MDTKEKPKPRRVTVTFDEYEAIRVGLNEIDCTLGSGHLEEEDLEKYFGYSKALKKLMIKIINAKPNGK